MSAPAAKIFGPPQMTIGPHVIAIGRHAERLLELQPHLVVDRVGRGPVQADQAPRPRSTSSRTNSPIVHRGHPTAPRRQPVVRCVEGRRPARYVRPRTPPPHRAHRLVTAARTPRRRSRRTASPSASSHRGSVGRRERNGRTGLRSGQDADQLGHRHDVGSLDRPGSLQAPRPGRRPPPGPPRRRRRRPGATDCLPSPITNGGDAVAPSTVAASQSPPEAVRVRGPDDRVLHPAVRHGLLGQPFRPEVAVRRIDRGARRREQREPADAGLSCGGERREDRAVVRRQDGVVIRLRGTADQVDHREDPLEDLRERIRIVEPAHGDLRPRRAQRFGRLGPANARPHLVVADEHRARGPARSARKRR